MQKRKTGTTRKVQVLKPEIGATALADAKATIADYLLAQIPKKTAGKHKDCLEAATIQACLGRLPMSQLEDMAGFLKITQMNEFGKTAEALKMLNPRLDLSVKEIEGKGRRKPYVAVKFITPDGELRESDFDLARLDGTIKLQVAVGEFFSRLDDVHAWLIKAWASKTRRIPPWTAVMHEYGGAIGQINGLLISIQMEIDEKAKL